MSEESSRASRYFVRCLRVWDSYKQPMATHSTCSGVDSTWAAREEGEGKEQLGGGGESSRVESSRVESSRGEEKQHEGGLGECGGWRCGGEAADRLVEGRRVDLGHAHDTMRYDMM